MWDQESLLDLVLHVDCLLFELQSCVDLSDTLLTRAYKETRTTASLKALERSHAQKVGEKGRKRLSKHWLTREILSREGLNITWVDRLEELRNLFIHQVAPYPRILTPSGNRRLIFLKENVANLDDRSRDVELSELKGIVQNFDEGAAALQKHLICFYQECNWQKATPLRRFAASPGDRTKAR